MFSFPCHFSCPYRCQEDLNCAQLVLKHAEARLGRPWPADIYRANASFYSGLGIGGICCGLLGALCVLGLVYDEDEAKQKGLILMEQFQALYGTLLCPRLQQITSDDCDAILTTINRLLDPLLPEPPIS